MSLRGPANVNLHIHSEPFCGMGNFHYTGYPAIVFTVCPPEIQCLVTHVETLLREIPEGFRGIQPTR